MRILVASDLHLEITGTEPIRRLVAGIDRENPDVVILAGDLGNPSHLFEQCLACFLRLKCPVAVVPGNHDIWSSLGETSIRLYEEILPEITRSMGFHWLDHAPLVLPGGVALCGNIAWYDYSAREPSYNQSDEDIIANKSKYAMDASMVDWEYTDIDFARLCREKLVRQMESLHADPNVQQIVLATHVPVFDQQIERNPENAQWSNGNPYFGHLTMGEAIRAFQKLRFVISGHTHVGMNGIVERPGCDPICAAVIDSDYLKPRWVELEI